MSSLTKIATGFLLLALTACDGIPGMQSAAALTRKGDPQACSHRNTKEVLDQVLRGSERTPSAEEVEALPIAFRDTTMTDANLGVSVTCRTLVELSNGHTESFVYSVLLSSENPSEIVLTWSDALLDQLALIHYADILYNWERRADRKPVNQSQEAPERDAAPKQVATAEIPRFVDSTMQLLYEHGGAQVGFTSDDETVCIHCGPDRSKVLDVGMGPGFVETSSGPWVVITEYTGNSIPGGSSFAIDLRNGRTVDLQTHSAGGPQFEFKVLQGEFGVEVTLSDEIRWVPLPS